MEERAHKTKVARAMEVKMQPGSSSSETIPKTTTFSAETGESTGKSEKPWPAMSEEN